jgi:hypothetical protein
MVSDFRMCKDYNIFMLHADRIYPHPVRRSILT